MLEVDVVEVVEESAGSTVETVLPALEPLCTASALRRVKRREIVSAC